MPATTTAPEPTIAGIARPDSDLDPDLAAELAELLGDPARLAAWRADAARCGYCANPIRMRGRVHHADPTTRQVREVYSTDDQPGGVLLMPCGNRRAVRCPACAERYRRDAYQLLRAGLVGDKGVPTSVRSHPAVFVTFTAPSFGEVHAHRTTKERNPTTRRLLPCRPRRHAPVCRHGVRLECRRRHQADDPHVGMPMCPRCYDYQAAVLWNANARELWRRTTIYLTRALARLTRQTPTALGREARIAFARVAEYQARGVIHLHVVIRLDHAQAAPDGSVQPPPEPYTVELLTQALRDTVHGAPADPEADLPAFAAVAVPVPSGGDIARAPLVLWGHELDIRRIAEAGSTTLSAERVAGYIAKYATKHTETLGPGLDQRINEFDLPRLRDRLRPHVARLVHAAWTLGGHEHLAGLQLREHAHQLGYGGHWSSRSRRYSTTFRALRRARIDYARRARLAAGRPLGADLVDDDQAVVVLATWTYAGSGYRTEAERQLALAAAARELARARRWRVD